MYLSVKNLSKTYLKRSGFLNTKTSAIHALQDVSFELEKGKCLAIVGESGSGKSTLAKIIMKLLEPDSGSIFISKKNVLNILKQKKKAYRKKIQMIFKVDRSPMRKTKRPNQFFQCPVALKYLNYKFNYN